MDFVIQMLTENTKWLVIILSTAEFSLKLIINSYVCKDKECLTILLFLTVESIQTHTFLGLPQSRGFVGFDSLFSDLLFPYKISIWMNTIILLL